MGSQHPSSTPVVRVSLDTEVTVRAHLQGRLAPWDVTSTVVVLGRCLLLCV